jgi:quinoprotein glucose dehydrogenase
MLKFLRQRPYVLAMVLLAVGLGMAVGGIRLARAGGSLYYLLAGSGLAIAGILAWRRQAAAAWLFFGITLATLIWALLESGLDPWALLPRLGLFAVLGVWFWMPWVRRALGLGRGALLGPALFGGIAALIFGSYAAQRFQPLPATAQTYTADAPGGTEWPQFGNTLAANRYVAAAQINRGNVAKLAQAWVYRTADKPHADEPAVIGVTFQVTPIKLGDALYFCTGRNTVIGIDADTGQEIWRRDTHTETKDAPHLACRGLASHVAAGDALCATRLLMGTVDNRLLALDAKTGESCADFGTNGAVDLMQGLGESLPGYSYVTSPPTVVNHVIVVGQWIFDNQSTDEPPGVVRGYDAITGRLLWAWDALSPLAHPPLQPGESYPRDTPNLWSIGSGDEQLGLVFLPMGNPPPDFFGGQRSKEQDRYNASVVALDVNTGNVSWSYQTVHHDIWDYDIGAQPVLIDFDTPAGRQPALALATKRGEIFILDRRNGQPLTAVEERPVPQQPAQGEWLSPTQPYSVGFPSFAPADLHESSMWGATPLDQLWCRVHFKEARYQGQFTPHSTQGAIIHAGSFGVIDWGSVSIDPERRLMLVNTSWMPFRQTLIPRKNADQLGVKPYGMAKAGDKPRDASAYTMFAQTGTPYAIDSSAFLSPLGFPCHEPPWGGLAAIDLTRKKVLWQRPLGTTRDAAPLGIALPTGVFNLGGSVTTKGGLVFLGATIDNYLRAFDTETGAELWRGRLPAGGQANTLSFVSGKTGRQYVVIAAGGHASMRTKQGDFVVAFALPK